MSNVGTILLRNTTKKMRNLLFYLVCIWSKWRIQNLLFRKYSSVKIHLYSSGSATNRWKKESRESTTLLHEGLSFLLITLGACIAIVFIFISKKKNPTIFWGWGGQLDCIQTITTHRSITVAICCRRKEIAVFCSREASEVIDWWGWGLLTMEASRDLFCMSPLPDTSQVISFWTELRCMKNAYVAENSMLRRLMTLSDNITWLRLWPREGLPRCEGFWSCTSFVNVWRMIRCQGYYFAKVFNIGGDCRGLRSCRGSWDCVKGHEAKEDCGVV